MLIFHTFEVFPPALLLLHSVSVVVFKRWLGPIGTFYATLATFSLSSVLTWRALARVLRFGHYDIVDIGRWFLEFEHGGIHPIFCADSLALIAASLVMPLTLLAIYFGTEYMYREAFINRLLYLLNLFATSVIFLFFCYDYFLILLIWECIGLFSFLLVNFYATRTYTIKAALKVFVFSRVSDMFMFVAFTLAVSSFSTTDLALIFTQTPFYAFHYLFVGDIAVHFLTLFAFSLALSGGIKGAQFVSHVWLPDAMEAPTPASALIHSSTLVIAGVFLIIRFSVVFEFATTVNYFLALWGASTLAFASVAAAFQTDVKKLVAYSTISQIGYLFCGCGFCCYEEVLVYLVVHALNKAFLFVLVGYQVHFFNANTDMRQMGGSYLYSFELSLLLAGCCLNLTGLPYSAGFLSKELLLAQVLRGDFVSYFVRACWLLSFFFTPVYMYSLLSAVYFGPKRGKRQVYSSSWKYSPLAYPYVPLRTPSLLCSFTAITSRLTSIILFTFWLFFNFYGESLLLLVMDFSTTSDSLHTAAFLQIKQHKIYGASFVQPQLIEYIGYYVYILTTAAVTYVMGLGKESSYVYMRAVAYATLVTLPLIMWLCLYV